MAIGEPRRVRLFSSAVIRVNSQKHSGLKQFCPSGRNSHCADGDAVVLLIADDFELYLLPAGQIFLDKDLLDATIKRPLESGLHLAGLQGADSDWPATQGCGLPSGGMGLFGDLAG